MATAQLQAAGLTRDDILGARRKGHLHPVHRRVYALGTGGLDLGGRLWAAHLAVGENSVIGYLSAGQQWAIRAWTGAVHVIAPKQRRRHPDVIVHEGRVPPTQIRRRAGLPFTSPARTYLDMATLLDSDELELAVSNGVARNVVRLSELDTIAESCHGHHGVKPLAAAVGAERRDSGSGGTHGEMEALFFKRLRALGPLPAYARNAILDLGEGFVVKADVLFVEERVWIELDSRSWHEQRKTMERDRRKDQRGHARGFAPFRITWRHLGTEWPEVVADLLRTLARRGPQRSWMSPLERLADPDHVAVEVPKPGGQLADAALARVVALDLRNSVDGLEPGNVDLLELDAPFLQRGDRRPQVVDLERHLREGAGRRAGRPVQ